MHALISKCGKQLLTIPIEYSNLGRAFVYKYMLREINGPSLQLYYIVICRVISVKCRLRLSVSPTKALTESAKVLSPTLNLDTPHCLHVKFISQAGMYVIATTDTGMISKTYIQSDYSWPAGAYIQALLNIPTGEYRIGFTSKDTAELIWINLLNVSCDLVLPTKIRRESVYVLLYDMLASRACMRYKIR